MNRQLTSVYIEPVCPYCGRENKHLVKICSGCTTPLSPDAVTPPPKSKFWAVVFAFFFGPLGLLYSSLVGAAVMLLVGIVVVFFLSGIPWSRFFYAICCAIWAYRAIDLHKGHGKAKASDEAYALLNQAADLERKDPVAAVARYQEIAQLYPDTDAGKEARRNIQTLTSSQQANAPT